MPLAPDDFLSGVIATRFGRTVWLSTTPAVGLASRPTRSRSIISAMSWMVRNRSSQTNRGNH
jgi:hypothetical protein